MRIIKDPLCIIPARGGSKRLERKNITILAGRPLLFYSIDSAVKSEIFDKICVSSEDNEILETARKYAKNNKILVLKRPAELSADNIQVKHVCKYLLEYFFNKGIKYTSFGVILPTSPLRNQGDIKEAYKIFKGKNAECVMSIVPFSHPPQRAVWVKNRYVEPYFGLKHMKQTQELDKLYRHDGAIIFCKSDSFLKNDGFYTNKILPYFIPKERTVDIDSPLDLKWAEFLLSKQK